MNWCRFRIINYKIELKKIDVHIRQRKDFVSLLKKLKKWFEIDEKKNVTENRSFSK